MNCTIAWSSSSPPVRIDVSDTIPESAMTAISVVPPPMSITMLPAGVSTGRPTPMAAAIGSATHPALPREAAPHDLARGLIDRAAGGLLEDDALPFHVDQGVAGTEIDRDLVGGAPGTDFPVRPA